MAAATTRPKPGRAGSRIQVRARRAELAALAPWLAPLRAWEEKAGRPGASDEASPALGGRPLVPGRPGNRPRRARRASRGRPRRDRRAGVGRPRAGRVPGGRRGRPRLEGRRACSNGSEGLGERAEALADAMDFRPLVQGRPPPLRDRLQPRAGEPRRRLLRPARLRIEPDEPPGRRAGRRPPPALVPAQPAVHPRGGPDRPGLVGRDDVRIPDAPAALLRSLPTAPSSPRRAGRPSPGRSSTAGRKGVPWGISESAFNAQYVDGDYQYQAFGVPGLGLKRGLERDLVVAPYATAMAAMIVPREALENFRRLAAGRRRRDVRVLRGDRLHARPRPQRAAVGRGPVVHGAPPGDEPGRPGERRARRPDAAAVPRRADGPGRRPALARARPARRAHGRAVRGRGSGGDSEARRGRSSPS